MSNDELAEICKTVLKNNDRGTHTVPANGFYPHQWLWDSCFIAIGLRHYDVERAQKEILSLLEGQWSNGMLPNMILGSGADGYQARTFWRSKVSPLSPDNLSTSGITQPPMVAEAVVLIGEKLSKTERRRWYRKVYPALLAHHKWLYNERDPHQEGLVLQIHPWETGLDNTPPWMDELHKHQMPVWIRLTAALHLDKMVSILRRDSFLKMPGERLSTIDGLAFFSIQRRLRRKRYDITSILNHSHITIEDVSFNAIFIRANHHLKKIATHIDRKLPKELLKNIKKTEQAYEQLWDPYSGQYYSRNFATNKLIKVPSIGTLLPLYGGHITQERAEQLANLLTDKKQFNSAYPVASVPLSSDWFIARGYWQGPTWINTNWLIIDGLKRYGLDDAAKHVREQTIKLIKKSGPSEYFSPKDGSPAGAKDFSWTAALIIDLLNQ